MKVIKQASSLDIIDYSTDPKPLHSRHSKLLPSTIRCIICGPSNCGKTNVMISLLLHKNGLKFRNVYLFSKTAFQPKYMFLKNVFKRIPEVKLFIFKENEEIIHPNKAHPDSIMIFDDVVCEKQSNIRNYFAMGRHNKVDSFYLSQTYSKVPKQLIRDNVNLLIIFKQDDINLKHIYTEHVNNDMTWLCFKNICSSVWKAPHSFLVIDKDSSLNNGRYREKFDNFIINT
ncbi:hypothetical protein JYU34_014706 [Plutella xylostella]|uniref:Uncharacterized protein n=1 Tax=Plutella xylostella TaxID=51655 RepID=A0ABQ7QCM3_PLUXY|nr:hypothetical protein JYU34_014706 [Plutella xylostella]